MNNKLKKFIVFLVLLAVIYPAFSALLKPGYFPIHDDIQTMRLYEMDKCVRDFQIPCRWVPDMGYGYGYPQFNYYAPLPYYVMEVFHLAGLSIINSVKIGFGLSIFFSALGIYLLGKTVWRSRIAGLTSAAFYVYFPYHAVNIYVRGAMGESWALSMMPFIFYSVYELVVKENKKAILYLALSVFGIATSHNVSTLIFMPFCAFWLIYLVSQKPNKNQQNLYRTIMGVLWGVGMSSFFLLPAWFEKKYVHVETIIQGYFDYLAHFVGLKQLLFSSYWGYGSSELGDFDGLSLSVGPIWWILPVAVLITLILLKRKEFKTVLLVTALGWFALFLIHPKSVFMWQKLNLLSFVQFPWRFLGIALFMFSFAAGAVVLLAKERKWLFVILMVWVIGFYSSFFVPSKSIQITDNEKFSGESWTKQQTISIFDYLPSSAKLPPARRAPETLISDSEINIMSDNSGSNWQEWKVQVAADNSLIKLPIFYFPGWNVTVNGEKKDVLVGEGIGEMQVMLDEGEYILRAELKNTPIRAFSNSLSLISILLILLLWKKLKK